MVCNLLVTINMKYIYLERSVELVKQRESSEIVKDRVLNTATDLFAQYGVSAVSIRKIAAEAGINHALIIRYFGTKDGLVKEILQRKISALAGAHPMKPEQPTVETLASLREILLNALTVDQNTMKLIVRSGLDGLSPESYVDGNGQRAANILAKWIESRQTGEGLPDAKLVSLIIIGSMFSLVSIAPWLMTAVDLPKDDLENREQDIMDVVIWMIAQSIGLPPNPDEFT